MLNITQAFSCTYYLENQRSFHHPNEYLNAGSEPDGLWFNPNDLLGLANGTKIDSKHFFRLYSGLHPETRQKLTQNAGSEKRSPGLNLDFSADKSVSALWAIAGDDLRAKIEHAHNDACRMALQEKFLEKCSYTRTRVGGAGGEIQVLPARLIGAMFQHGTSRAGDPHLHTHCVIFNAVQTEQDGRWRALHQKPFYYLAKSAGAAYRSHIATKLVQLDIQIERYGRDNAYVRIKGFPQDLLKLWSKRHSDIQDLTRDVHPLTGNRPANPWLFAHRPHHYRHRKRQPDQRHALWRDECQTLHHYAAVLSRRPISW